MKHFETLYRANPCVHSKSVFSSKLPVKRKTFKTKTNIFLCEKSCFLRKMQGENANKIHHVYNAIIVLHICNKIWGIPSPGYPGNKNQILMLMKFWVVYYDLGLDCMR